MTDKNPIIMGILNLTPDSFFDGNSYPTHQSALTRIKAMISEGAQIIDIGGESTRPNCQEIDTDTEWNRIKNVLRDAINYNTPISIDTYKPQVAERALQNGATIINDIAAFEHLDEIVQLAKKYSADLIVTHNSRKSPFTNFDDLIIDIINKFRLSIQTAHKYYFDEQKLIFDIGLGFGKTNQQNVTLLSKLSTIRSFFNQRFLIGASRKSFMREFGEYEKTKRLPCTLGATFSAYLSGCNIFRVHDIHQNIEILKLAQKLYGN